VTVSAIAPMTGYYDDSEVARSVLIAIAASYAALDLTGRVAAASGRVRLAWLSGGAIAMGFGIWAMHIKGMLAFHLSVPVEYHWPTVLAGLLVAILASAVAVYVASRQKMGWHEALTGSLIMGSGIAGLHYIGMAAMRLPAITRYSPLLIACSILLAVLFSLIALLMAFDLREETRWTVPRRVGSAIVMGLAVSAMHYTGMAAASFIPAPPPDFSHAVSISAVGNNGIAIVTLIVLVAAMVTSSVDRRATVEFERLNQDLERRVAKRTLQLEEVNRALRKEIAERERAEAAVRRSEDRLRLVIDTIPQQIWSGPPDGSLDFCNTQWLSFMGLTQEEAQGEGWQRMLHPDDRERVLTAWRESVANGTPYEQEERHRRADGRYRWFLARGVPLRDSEGRIVRWYGTNTDIEDRKEAEDRLRRVIDTLPALVWSKLPDGSADFLNQRFREYTGLSEEEGLGWGWMRNAFHPEDRAEEEWRAAFAVGEPFEKEARLRRADGAYRWFLLRAVPLRDQRGNVVKWYGTTADIEDRKRAEDELRKQKEVFQRIFENIPVMIAFMGEDRHVELVNSEWERTLGWTLQEIREQNLDIYTELFPDPQYREMVLDVVAASTGEWTDLKVKVRDGQVIDVAGNLVRLSDGSTLGIGRDVTERKRAEAELRESEARFRLVADSAPVMIWMSGTDKLCTYFNKSWLDFTGRSIDQELGNGWTEGVHPEDLQRCLDTYTQAFDRREAFRMEYRLRRYDGEFRWVLDLGVPRFNPDGSFAGYIGSCIDVTEQRRAEEQVRQAQGDLTRVARIATMGELTASIAHEINQPLAAVAANASASLHWLAVEPPNLAEARQAMTNAMNEADRASRVIERLRTLLKKVPPQLQPVNVNQVIRDVLALAHRELITGGVAIRTELATDLPAVLGDRVQLQQVMLNLVMNAIDAMITIKDRPRLLVIKSASDGEDVLVEVQDSGKGLDPQQASRIFDSFFTTKPDGIGMGLSISRSIVEAHGGRLQAEPGSSHGAVFQVILPKAA
jgi:PAS domain S-box-containing protein